MQLCRTVIIAEESRTHTVLSGKYLHLLQRKYSQYIIACFSLFVKRFPKKVSGGIWNAPLRIVCSNTDPYTTPARRQPSGGFMIDIGFYINAL